MRLKLTAIHYSRYVSNKVIEITGTFKKMQAHKVPCTETIIKNITYCNLKSELRHFDTQIDPKKKL